MRPGSPTLTIGDPDRDDLHLRRLHARAGVHLHVPVAAHPDRDARRAEPDRHLQGLARRTARPRRQAPRGGCGGAPSARRLHRLHGQCVAVCPTGIDIREGPQIGCITCALCIDACDQVMDKIGKPARADRLHDDRRRAPRAAGPARRKTPLQTPAAPAHAYSISSVWVAIGAAMLFTLGTRDADRAGRRARAATRSGFCLSDGQVRNSYTIKLRNMENRTRRYELSVRGIDGRMWNQEMNREAATPTVTFEVEPDSVLKQKHLSRCARRRAYADSHIVHRSRARQRWRPGGRPGSLRTAGGMSE